MSPRLPTIDDVRAAAKRLEGLAVRTPLLEHPALNARVGGRVLLKAECLQRVGAFKFRGAYNKISQLDRAAWPGGVVACSSGNHAQGVAAAARLCDMHAGIVMPSDAPRIKVARTRAFGGEVIFYDRVREDRDAIAQALCTDRGAAFVAPYDDADVVAGQGTVGLELMEEAAAQGIALDAVLTGCSGGGLVSGVSLAVKDASPGTEIFAVEPAGFDDMARSLAAGTRQQNPAPSGSLCDALMAPSPGVIPFEIARRTLNGALAVTDAEACEAVRFAFSELKLVLEPSGAVGLAALLTGKFPAEGRTVAVVLTGGNVDPEDFARIITGAPGT